MLVACPIEKGFSPSLFDSLSQFTFLNWVFNLCILTLPIHTATVVQAIITKLEGMLVDHWLIFRIEDFEQYLFVFKWVALCILAKGKKVFSVNTIVSFSVRSESADVESTDIGSNFAPKTRLLGVNRYKSETVDFVSPETAKGTLSVPSCHPKRN